MYADRHSVVSVEPDFYGIEPALLERTFQRLGADDWMARNRVVNSYETPYDINATAARIGAVVTWVSFEDGQYGQLKATEDAWSIEIPDTILPGSSADYFTTGHEIGHIFLLEQAIRRSHNQARAVNNIRALRSQRHYQKVEAFCEYFATKMMEYEL